MSLASAVEPLENQIIPLGYLFEDSFGAPPTAETAAGYNTGLDAFEFLADVDQLMVPLYPGEDLPQITIIDTRVMEIVYKAGYFNEEEILTTANAL